MNSGPTLSSGSQGAEVKRLQRVLVMMKLLDYTKITGNFGPLTRQAVEQVQADAGLVVDGIVGPQTWQALPADPGTIKLAIGATGTTVSALQAGLTKYAPTPASAAHPGGVDGVFGSKTDAAVRAYQTERGVTVDGILGDETWWVPAGGAGATLASLAELTTI
ncbi:MAG: peptidoglycan-binding domain-containing protein [Chthoniobacteraceae bacterium]